jgi:hypothetical protein
MSQFYIKYMTNTSSNVFKLDFFFTNKLDVFNKLIFKFLFYFFATTICGTLYFVSHHLKL